MSKEVKKELTKEDLAVIREALGDKYLEEKALNHEEEMARIDGVITKVDDLIYFSVVGVNQREKALQGLFDSFKQFDEEGESLC